MLPGKQLNKSWELQGVFEGGMQVTGMRLIGWRQMWLEVGIDGGGEIWRWMRMEVNGDGGG